MAQPVMEGGKKLRFQRWAATLKLESAAFEEMKPKKAGSDDPALKIESLITYRRLGDELERLLILKSASTEIKPAPLISKVRATKM